MSFNIGSGGANMGPRRALQEFGAEAEKGAVFNWTVVRRMLAFLRPYAAAMTAALLLMLVATGMTLLAPYLIKVAIDDNIAGGNEAGLARTALLILGSFMGLYAASALQRFLLSWVGQRVLANMRQQLFDHLQALPLGYHDTHIVGVTVSRVINDVSVINELLSQGLITVLGDLLILGGIIVVMLQLSPRLALYTFVVLPLMIVVTWVFSRHARRAFRMTRTTVARLVGSMAETLDGIRVIKAFTQEPRARARFAAVNRENRDALIGAMQLSFIFLPVVEFLGVLATAIVLWFGGRSVIEGGVTLGVMVAFMAYVTRFFQPIQELSQMYTMMQSAMAGGEQVLRVLDTPPLVADRPDAPDAAPLQGEIRLDNVSFAYRDDTPTVLRDVDLTVRPGQTVALVGPTGAGKSSIANLIARFYDASSGAVSLDGTDVRDVAQQSLRRQMGIVTQDPFLFAGTIADNIRFGKPDAGTDDMAAAAELANAAGFIADLPHGYDTEILEGGVNLSVGQRQLLAIARAVLADPRILIMDEATANVDTLTEALIQEALERLLHGRTAIVIAHRLSTIRNADLICVVDEGRIVARGTHASLLAEGGLYRALYDRQFLAVDESG